MDAIVSVRLFQDVRDAAEHAGVLIANRGAVVLAEIGQRVRDDGSRGQDLRGVLVPHHGRGEDVELQALADLGHLLRDGELGVPGKCAG